MGSDDNSNMDFNSRKEATMHCVCMWLYFFGSCHLFQILPSPPVAFVPHEVNYVVPWQAPLYSAPSYRDPEAMEPRDGPLVKRNLSSEFLVLNWVNAWKMLGINAGRCCVKGMLWCRSMLCRRRACCDHDVGHNDCFSLMRSYGLWGWLPFLYPTSFLLAIVLHSKALEWGGLVDMSYRYPVPDLWLFPGLLWRSQNNEQELLECESPSLVEFVK